jgi:hypothetical protein
MTLTASGAPAVQLGAPVVDGVDRLLVSCTDRPGVGRSVRGRLRERGCRAAVDRLVDARGVAPQARRARASRYEHRPAELL